MAGRRRLVVLAVLAGCAGPAAPSVGRAAARSPAQRATAYLERAQNEDGGLGQGPGQPSASLFSGWAALGLASAGVDLGTLRRASADASLLHYVRAGAGAPDTGSLERTILVLRAAGAPAGPLTARLLGRVSPRGSVAGQVNLTAFALLALRAAGDPATAGVRGRLAAWLVGEADADGGYGYAGRGGDSDADDTGAVLEALSAAGNGSAVSASRRRAVAYLRRDQDADGGFPAAPGAGSDAQSTAWAIQGLLAAGVPPASVVRDGHTPLRYLDSLVSADGAVSYAPGQTQTPVWVTGEALMALTGTPLPFVGRSAAPSGSRSPRSHAQSATRPPRRAPARPGRVAGRDRRPRTHRGRARPRPIPMLAPAAERMRASLGDLAATVIARLRLGPARGR